MTAKDETILITVGSFVLLLIAFLLVVDAPNRDIAWAFLPLSMVATLLVWGAKRGLW